MDQTSQRLMMAASAGPVGQAAYTTPGVHSWTCPPGVFFVCAVCVGAAGGVAGYASNGLGQDIQGGGAGGLGWKNNIPVVPGTNYTVVVGDVGANFSSTSSRGAATAGGQSYFVSAATVAGLGGGGGNTNTLTAGVGGGFVGDGGGNGGGSWGHSIPFNMDHDYWQLGGPGAGGYAGNGGDNLLSYRDGSTNYIPYPYYYVGAGGGGAGHYSYLGGGVGILGQGASGSSYGAPGSGGAGEQYGGGGAVSINRTPGVEVVSGGSGAVRIIWGPGRAFPSTLTGNL